MNSVPDSKLEPGVLRLIGEGEEVLAAFVGSPLGAEQVLAERDGLRASSPMALALTPRRLLTLRIGSSIELDRVREVVDSVSLFDVEAIEVNRLPRGQLITITSQGEMLQLLANAPAATEALADEFERAKALVPNEPPRVEESRD
jgi:hypothetical protein